MAIPLFVPELSAPGRAPEFPPYITGSALRNAS